MKKSIHEFCPTCGSTDRDNLGIESNLMVEDVMLWHCNGCNKTYDGPIPPYTDNINDVDICIEELTIM